ncbi:BQ2448_3979 [Microbotryum intermedium]|uniref:BQ2448_3979 protein n=1 Tax=Microbotryum intermedium TaxID=269621 RepID=A0A238FF45_9BASI|nr:BQ2448_3979 [Microbotryum intermedium]
MKRLDDQFDHLGALAGVSGDQIKLITLIVAAVPLSLVFPHLPSSTVSVLPHLYAALPSVFYLCFVLHLRRGFLELVLSSLAAWTIVKVGVATKRKDRLAPWLVFVVVMGHLAVNHVIRHFEKTGIETIEITGSQMVLCMKLISFAWSVYDGQQPIDELDSTQRASRIVEVPGLVPFLGYALFFPSILAGPSFTFASYTAWTSHALYLKETGLRVGAASSASRPRDVIPEGRRRKAAKRFVTGAVYLGIFSMYSYAYAYQRMLEPPVRVLPLWKRIGFMQIAGFVARTKYYGVWCIAESAFIISGLGYNPRTKHYDASRNVRIRSIEFAPNFKILLDSWNMNTNVWLRECIYKRVTSKGRKPGFVSTQITFITSALWHGVNPCYLMTFVLGGLLQSTGRSMRALVRPFFLPPGAVTVSRSPAPSINASTASVDATTPPVTEPEKPVPPKLAAPPQTPLKWIYDIAGIIVTQLALNFAVAPFMLLTVHGSLAAWHSVSYYGILMVLIPTIALRLGLAKTLEQQLKARNAAAEKMNDSEEKKRVEWEQEVERKRMRRGVGVASLAPDVEELLLEEEREEARSAKASKKAQ